MALNNFKLLLMWKSDTSFDQSIVGVQKSLELRIPKCYVFHLNLRSYSIHLCSDFEENEDMPYYVMFLELDQAGSTSKNKETETAKVNEITNSVSYLCTFRLTNLVKIVCNMPYAFIRTAIQNDNTITIIVSTRDSSLALIYTFQGV